MLVKQKEQFQELFDHTSYNGTFAILCKMVSAAHAISLVISLHFLRFSRIIQMGEIVKITFMNTQNLHKCNKRKCC